MIEKAYKAVQGFSFFGKNIGIKDDTLDFGGILATVPCQSAAVFTRNTMPGAPVLVGKEHIEDGRLQAIIVNSKNANVATEERGYKDSKRICELVAASCDLDASLVLPSSTGVIGRTLPMDIIEKGCESVASDFGTSDQHVEDFARAIMTTDSHPKYCSASLGGISLMGFAKGAGMIDKRVVNQSFNRISVDSDTSTSDTVVVMANGLGGQVDLEAFEATLLEMCIYLAKEIARDGEGATKLIELTVSGASTSEQALLTAKSCINSPLVKTAIYGADPNWGRFVMAIGKVFDYQVDISELTLLFGQGSERLKIDKATLDTDSVPLDAISELLKKPEVFIEISLGSGQYSDRVWGCDLTEGYVEENAYYTT